MNIVDVLLLLIILFSVYSGFRKGFIYGAVDLIILAVSLVFSFYNYGYVAAFLSKHFPSLSVWTSPLAFLLCYIFIRIILSLLAGVLLRSMTASTHENIVNRSLGILPGLVNGLLYAAIISALLLALPVFDGLSAKTRNSALANELTPHVEWAEEKIAPVLDSAINRSINNLTVSPHTEKEVKLPFTVKDPEIREDLEARMLLLVNEERRKEGLDTLKADPEMREVARAHSRDMFARGYFSHITPEGKTPADRARAKDVSFLIAGENLALAQTLRIAHNGLMNSPGHKANILHTAYGRVGIGVLQGGRYGLMITQNFRN
jgi:uncharacterized protein YkwD